MLYSQNALQRCVRVAASRATIVWYVVLCCGLVKQVAMDPERDVQMSEMLPSMRPYCPCETMDSEVGTLFFRWYGGVV